MSHIKTCIFAFNRGVVVNYLVQSVELVGCFARQGKDVYCLQDLDVL